MTNREIDHAVIWRRVLKKYKLWPEVMRRIERRYLERSGIDTLRINGTGKI